MTAPWRGPLDLSHYDQTPTLSSSEVDALEQMVRWRSQGKMAGPSPANLSAALVRLIRPIDDAMFFSSARRQTRYSSVGLVLKHIHRHQHVYWAWSRDEWLELVDLGHSVWRQHLLACAYWLGGQRDLHARLRIDSPFRYALACKVFGAEPVDEAVKQVAQVCQGWGCGPVLDRTLLPRAVCELLLRSGSPRLAGITIEAVRQARESGLPVPVRWRLDRVVRALEELALLGIPGEVRRPLDPVGQLPAIASDVPLEWARWCQRWRATTTVVPASRRTMHGILLQVGRWLAATHPEVQGPHDWTRELCAEYIAAVDRMHVGDWVHQPLNPGLRDRVGKPIMPRSKDHYIRTMCRFLEACQEWGWINSRFDIRRALQTPKSILALIGPDPRVIADDMWAKLLWAGINLTADDIPRHSRTNLHWYPPFMLRALAVTWLFAGIRQAELLRLRVGCVRWQHDDVPVPGSDSVLGKDAVCWLDIPVSKTDTAFTKAVDRMVGKAIEVWEAERPMQPVAIDVKTGEAVQLLFAYRGKRIGRAYLNYHLIPMLCHKAGVPVRDARGRITSHRARSTIATQLYNSKEPLTLFELQEWLGHRSIESTQQYAKIAPTRLAKAYEAAGYFQRNLRMVEVLVDREAVVSRSAAAGEAWRFYDLGHGYCTYDFFDQCPHRMACAKCSFYMPKGSTRAQLLEGKANLLRMKQEIPLRDDEAAAVEDGLAALEQLCARLADVPTPAGPTPRELGLDR